MKYFAPSRPYIKKSRGSSKKRLTKSTPTLKKIVTDILQSYNSPSQIASGNYGLSNIATDTLYSLGCEPSSLERINARNFYRGIRVQWAFNNNCTCNTSGSAMIRLGVLRFSSKIPFGDSFFAKDDNGTPGFTSFAGAPKSLFKIHDRLSVPNGYDVLWNTTFKLDPITDTATTSNCNTGSHYVNLRNEKNTMEAAGQEATYSYYVFWYAEPTTVDPGSGDWIDTSVLYARVHSDMYYHCVG